MDEISSSIPPVWAPPASRFIDVDKIRTFYITAGSGPAVILLHGAGPGACTQINWKHNFDPLTASGLRVYAFDQPGFGHSGQPRDYSVEYRIRHARAFIDALGLDRVHLAGNSFGAYIAACIALEDQRVQRLVLVASSILAPKGSAEAVARAQQHRDELRAFTPSRESIRALSLKTVFNAALITDQFVEERLAMSSGERFEAELKRRNAPPPAPVGDRLRDLRTKTLILWGADDQGATVERALSLAALIPDAELHLFNRCGHWVQWDQAARFNRIVADFLKS